MCMVVFISMRIIYRPYIDLLVLTCVGIYVIVSVVMYSFQNLCVILSVCYLINPVETHTVHTRTHKWNVYGYLMKQNVSMDPFTTSNHI